MFKVGWLEVEFEGIREVLIREIDRFEYGFEVYGWVSNIYKC